MTRKGRGAPWTTEETELIKKYYPLGGSKACIEMGVKRTADSIKQYAIKIGVKMTEEAKAALQRSRFPAKVPKEESEVGNRIVRKGNVTIHRCL